MQRHGRNLTLKVWYVCQQRLYDPHHHQPLSPRARRLLWQPRPL